MKKIYLIGFQISIPSISILLFAFIIGYFLLSILIYTLKNKWNLSTTSYNETGFKMATEYSKKLNNRNVKLSNYRFFHKSKSIYLDEKISFNNSIWSQTYSLFKVIDNSYYFRLVMVLLQIVGWPLIFFNLYIINILGISFIVLSWFIGILCTFQSLINVNKIKKTLYQFFNKNDQKKLNSILKYYKFYGLYISLLVIPHIIIDFFKWIKSNGIKDK